VRTAATALSVTNVVFVELTVASVREKTTCHDEAGYRPSGRAPMAKFFM
jgi:hypothetical protein